MKKAFVNIKLCVACGCCLTACKLRAITLPRGVYAVIDEKKCVGCGMCARGCPANCIQPTDYTAPGHKKPSLKIDASQCVKCGACISTCRFKAIEKR